MDNHLLRIKEAQNRISSVIKKTPLIYSELYSDKTGNNVYLKPENLQRTGSFKLRGAYNKIAMLDDEQKKKGLVTASAGNHAQGVAYGARHLGMLATIVMPKQTPFIKVESTKEYGAEVVLWGSDYDQAYQKALEIVQERESIFIHPFDDLDVIYGQGTIALEIIEELATVEAILVPVGGGGLVAGVALAAKAINPLIRIIGVEAEGAPTLTHALKNRRVSALDNVNTIAEGTAVKKAGEVCYDIIKDQIDDIILISEQELMNAFLIMLEKHKLVCEHSGVLSLAATEKLNFYNKDVVSLISGGNTDVVTISSMINNGLVSSGRLFGFSVELPDRPGQLVRIAEILSTLNANVIKLEHNQFKAFNRIQNVVLEVTVETYGFDHIGAITSELEKEGYTIRQIY